MVVVVELDQEQQQRGKDGKRKDEEEGKRENVRIGWRGWWLDRIDPIDLMGST